MRLTACWMFLITASCVSQGTYDQLKADHDKALASLSERETALAEARTALEREEAKSRQLSAAMTKLEADLGATEKDRTALEASLSDLKKRKAESEARIAEFRALLDKFKGLIDAGKLKVRIREGRMVVELATDILFPSGSARLSKDGTTAIEEVAQLLRSIPDRNFQIEGHTDNVPVKGSKFSNWDLASERALTVVRTMIQSGMAAERISAASYGDSKPARPNDTTENKAANRRIEIVVVPDLSSLPGADELQRAQN